MPLSLPTNLSSKRRSRGGGSFPSEEKFRCWRDLRSPVRTTHLYHPLQQKAVCRHWHAKIRTTHLYHPLQQKAVCRHWHVKMLSFTHVEAATTKAPRRVQIKGRTHRKKVFRSSNTRHRKHAHDEHHSPVELIWHGPHFPANEDLRLPLNRCHPHQFR